jgi:hypothetical protein
MVKRSTFERLGAGLALATTVALGTTACGPETVSADNRPTASASQTPGASETTKAPETDPVHPASILESKQFAGLSPQEQEKIRAIHNQPDVKQFEQLSGPERKEYAQFVIDVYQPYAEQQVPKYGAAINKPNRRFSLPSAYGTPSEKSSAQDICLMQAWKSATITWMLAEPTAPFKISTANKLDAMRALSAVYSDPLSQEYIAAKTRLMSMSGDLVSQGSDGYTLSTAMAWSDPVYNADAKAYRKRVNSYSTDSVMTQWEMFGRSVETPGGGSTFVWTVSAEHPEGSPGFEDLPHKA